MASQLLIEEETGTYVRTQTAQPHNGYYAGDFSVLPVQDPYAAAAGTAWDRR